MQVLLGVLATLDCHAFGETNSPTARKLISFRAERKVLAEVPLFVQQHVATACLLCALWPFTRLFASSMYDSGMKLARFPLARSRWDAVTAAVLIGLSFVPGLAQQGLELAASPDRPLNLLGITLIVLQGGSVAILRRWPQWSLALAFSAFSAYQLFGFPTTFAALGLLVAVVGAGAMLQRHRMLISILALGCYATLVAALIPIDATLTVPDALAFGALLAALWIFGSWLRTQATMRRDRAGQAEREAISAERARIAHELHDVVTHHVTAILVQAEAGQYHPDLDRRTLDLLASIADGGPENARGLAQPARGAGWESRKHACSRRATGGRGHCPSPGCRPTGEICGARPALPAHRRYGTGSGSGSPRRPHQRAEVCTRRRRNGGHQLRQA